MKTNLYGVILAAGNGTRMKSCLPKVLHKVCGKELISYVIDCCEALKVGKTYIVTGNGSEQVKQFLNKYGNVETVLQKERLGSAHAFLQAKSKMKKLTGNVIVMCGDTPLITSSTIKKLVDYHIKNKNDATILSGFVGNPFGYGRIVRDMSGNVSSIVEEKSANEKEKSINEINSGIYCFNLKTVWKALDKVKPNNSKKEYYLTDVISILNKDGFKTDAFAICKEEEILGVNDRAQLACAGKILKERILSELMINGVTIEDPSSTYIYGNVKIAQDTVIKPNTFIEGDVKIGTGCVIGPDTSVINSEIKNNVSIKYSYIDSAVIEDNVKIGPFSHIRPGAVLKQKVKVGNFSEVKKSVVGEGSKVNHLSYIGDALVGKDVNIGAGTITCNYDGVSKYKTVLGDNVFVGSNTNLVAPVNIGKNVLIAAGSTITENVVKNKLVIARSRQIIKEKKNKKRG
ncbi:bifunctional UDP-N-acetylglucosamine diphosphorylase/glucosamine-1-phosphate N-acetyltransferase GlmU [Candidatus Ruminimicrobium bovinum]|uniref:bifunctional UDP-N-acetylglucosamine diphosphorylase/glucosamine-1-phosphate N-acetyltransferase GlmU n=1 Tax=Candidatus Ruminimicrobium bovinum TaxID=3242779 RepID=UPI0039B99294